MGGEFGGDWIHVYVWLSPFTVHLKLSQPCYLAVPQYIMFLVLIKIPVAFFKKEKKGRGTRDQIANIRWIKK